MQTCSPTNANLDHSDPRGKCRMLSGQRVSKSVKIKFNCVRLWAVHLLLGEMASSSCGKHTCSLHRPPVPEGCAEDGLFSAGSLSPREGFVSVLSEDPRHLPCCCSCSLLLLHWPLAPASPTCSNPGRATVALKYLPGHTALQLE